MEGFALSVLPQSVHRPTNVQRSGTQAGALHHRRSKQSHVESLKGGHELASSRPLRMDDEDPVSPRFNADARNVTDRNQEQLRMWADRVRALPPSGRSFALAQLLRLEQEGAFSGLVGGSPDGDAMRVDGTGNSAFDTTEPVQRLSPADRRHVTEIVAGVTRWRRRLSWVLGHLPKPTNISSMDLPLQVLLLMGTYEILVLDMAPHAVNEYVEIAKIALHKGCGAVENRLFCVSLLMKLLDGKILFFILPLMILDCRHLRLQILRRFITSGEAQGIS